MGGSSTTTNKTEYDPAYMARINANYDRTKGIADSPFKAFTGERVAGFTPTQRQGQASLLSAANDPTSTIGMNEASGAVRGILNFRPEDIKPWMNPYTDEVVNASMADLERARGIQRVADSQHSTMAGAFGGSRHGVADSLTNDNYLRTVASTSANLRDKAFNTGASNAFNAAGLKLNAGQSLATISDQQLRQALMKAGVIQTVGDQEQDQQQNVNDAAYEEYLREFEDPYQKQALLNTALGAYPVQATTTSTQKNKVGIGQIIGGLLGGAQTAAGMGWKPF